MTDPKANTAASLLANYKTVYKTEKPIEAIEQGRERTRRFKRIRRRLKKDGKVG